METPPIPKSEMGHDPKPPMRGTVSKWLEWLSCKAESTSSIRGRYNLLRKDFDMSFAHNFYAI